MIVLLPTLITPPYFDDECVISLMQYVTPLTKNKTSKNVFCVLVNFLSMPSNLETNQIIGREGVAGSTCSTWLSSFLLKNLLNKIICYLFEDEISLLSSTFHRSMRNP